MKARLAAVVVIVAALFVTQAHATPIAMACSEIPSLFVSPAQLADYDAADTNGAIQAGYRDYWEDSSAPRLLGGFVIETVHTVEPQGDWTRGSVSTVVETWGQPPTDLGPFLHDTADLAVEPLNSCGDPSDGPALGTRRFMLVSEIEADGDWRFIYGSADEAAAISALTAVFGEPTVVDRDVEAEELMLAKLGNTRSGSGRSIAIAFGVILVVGSVLSYRYRKRRLLWQWDQIKAETEAEAGDAELPDVPN